MNVYFAEFLGTLILVLLGNGVVANVLLSGTKGHNAGWLAIAAGWALAVFTAVLCVGDISGAHINPAVTVGLAAAGEFAWRQVPGFVVCQLAGALVGACVVYGFYYAHYRATDDPDRKLATFCTSPAIRSLPLNLFSEAIGTFVLVYAVLMTSDPSFAWGGASEGEEVKIGLGSIGAMRVAFIVFAIGISLGGTTGYAINPARDLGPRLAHAWLRIAYKRDSDWRYAPIPVLGPILGGLLAAAVYRLQ